MKWFGLVLVICLTALSFSGVLDQAGYSAVTDALKRALIGFAIARGLNGVISVAQGTEFAIQPAGVGLSFSPGEILDPVNDVVEAFSWIMLVASSSLGIQQVMLLMSQSGWLQWILPLCGALWLLSRLRWPERRFGVVIGRVFLLVLILRFMMPAIALANQWVYEEFLAASEQTASVELEQARERIGELNAEVSRDNRDEESGVVDRARQLVDQVRRGLDVEAQLSRYRTAADTVSENIVRLIVVFVLQSLVFPLLFLGVTLALIRRLSAWSWPWRIG